MRRSTFALFLAFLLLAAGCSTNQRDEPEPRPRAGGGGDARASELEAALAERDRTIAELRRRISELEGRPAPVPAAGGAVSVSIQAPSDTFPGEPVPYRVTVANNQDRPAVDVSVWAVLAPGMEPADTGTGQWDAASRTLRWGIPSMAPRATEVFQFSTAAAATGDYEHCVHLSHRATACATVRVNQPALACQVSAAEVQLLGHAFAVSIAVINTGTGVAGNVVGDLTLSQGLGISGGSNQVDFGSIPAGQRVERQIQVTPAAPGPYQVEMAVRGAPGLATACGVQGQVVFPQLEIVKTGPPLRFQGQTVEYRIQVASTGTTVARNVVVDDPLPPGTRFLSSSEPGRPAGNSVQWSLGDLEPGQSREMSLVLAADLEGILRNCARVQAVDVPPKEACAETEIRYVPAMLITNEDSADPVEVGSETVYTVRIKNEGMKVTTNVVVRCDLPGEGEYVGSECAAATGAHDPAANRLVFSPIPAVRPGEEVAFRIRVRFTQPGSAVCSAVMTFAEFTKEVRSEEGTTIYQ
ncbi:MAG: DUF11 domain-containing protein [Planctomycetes bacterium]|nr:DUF11 domain-containing protein [Planctomycetota bacterium]